MPSWAGAWPPDKRQRCVRYSLDKQRPQWLVSSGVEKFPDPAALRALFDGLSVRVHVLWAGAVLQKEKNDLPLLLLGLRGATPPPTGALDCQVKRRRPALVLEKRLRAFGE